MPSEGTSDPWPIPTGHGLSFDAEVPNLDARPPEGRNGPESRGLSRHQTDHGPLDPENDDPGLIIGREAPGI